MIRTLLIALLYIGGGVQLLAVFTIFIPHSWMVGIHDLMDIGDLPDLPIVAYLTRSESLLYAMWGATYVFVAGNVDRYLPLVRFLAVIKGIGGIGFFIIDLAAGMPWYWTFSEGPSLTLYAAVVWWLGLQRSRQLTTTAVE